MSAANQYIRQVLHRPEAPPPIKARFFYTSPIPIDDPLSPVPPPPSGSVPVRLPPKPFSEYDNAALDKAWNELRRKILKHNEERGEKSRSHEGSRTRREPGVVRDGRRGSSSKPATSRSRPVKPPASNLSQVDGPPTSDSLEAPSEQLDGPQSAIETSSLPDTTGTPFIRAPSRKKVEQLDDRPTRPKFSAHDTYLWDDPSHLAEHSPPPEQRHENDSPQAKVAVGVSRLHHVEMPDLQMTPIYWEPVHDTADVTRGTWFYQETMLPVETRVANMLEAGYVDLQVWTETWKDELNSAVEVGAAGEMKIVHQLWPDKVPPPTDSRPSSRRGTISRDDLLRTATTNLIEGRIDTPEQARDKNVEAACDLIDISTGPGGSDNKASEAAAESGQDTVRSYTSYGVIYKNAKEARLLKPSLLPSTYYGRRPLANYIRKGHKIGISVVRGFDQTAWDKLHPTRSSPKAIKAEQGVGTSASGAPPHVRSAIDPDLARAERPKVTDLVLVVHGIGQKLSRRMESWHFTHAMNAFRREINVEVGSKEVNSRFRPGMGGIMVLPVNWRQKLAFEEGGYTDDDAAIANEFSLKDITPETLPSVRSLVSDVMLDVPYYMSHHQPKMIAAVINEANRVYRLWCQNNPGFAETGRVHIIAHSLGSVMAIDILSRQPSTLPKSLSDSTVAEMETEQLDHFLFNTSNLFLAGSPAGFFLLLKKAQLLPRIDRPSASSDDDPASSDPAICGERGQYGCIPVDNIYNIINGYDPVAYRMNATVDATYASLLKRANIPSASAGWFSRSSGPSWFGGGAGGGNAGSKPAQAPVLPRLPSNVELEIHNFTREEIAEKRMMLLNDNGQIDFFLRYGGGALDIQYLTMLSAHGSYWLLKDFTRMIVLEVGREKGREGTLTGMRAVKKKSQVKGLEPQ